MPTATLHEVAKIAGVSKATVSRVINQSPRVAPAMAQAVHKAMESMVYQPPASRRGPKPLSRKGIRKGNLLLLLLGFPLSAGHRFNSYPAILDGIENCTRHNGLKLLMASIEDDTALPAALNAGEADGVLLFGDTAVLTPAARAKLQDLPVVGLMRGMDALRGLIDRISYNNAAVGPIAAQHLLGRGHRRLAFFNTDPRHPAFIQRRDDFAAAAVAAAPAGAPLLALVSRQRPPDFRQELLASEALLDRMLGAPQRPTGLFVAADYQLPALYLAMERRGLAPGRDLDIISCDNMAQHLEQLAPCPATIDINMKLVGSKGVEQLLWRMDHRNLPNAIEMLIEPVLVHGPSESFSTVDKRSDYASL